MFHFVNVSDQEDAAVRKRKIRTHAAKNSLARQKRVLEHQKSQLAVVELNGGVKREPKTRSTMKGGSRVIIPVAYSSPRSVLSAGKRDPFETTVRVLTPFEQYLLSHFVNNVIQYSEVNLVVGPPVDEAIFRQGMAHDWGQAALGNVGLLSVMLFGACRNLASKSASAEDRFQYHAMRYKLACITYLKDSVARSGDKVTDDTLTTTMTMASEASLSNERDEMCSHLQAATRMIQMKGGLEALDLTGLLGKLAVWFIEDPLRKGRTLLHPPCILSIGNLVAGFIERGREVYG